MKKFLFVLLGILAFTLTNIQDMLPMGGYLTGLVIGLWLTILADKLEF